MKLMQMAMRFAASPQGRRALTQARRWAKRPENRETILGFVDRARRELRSQQDQRDRRPSTDTERTVPFEEPGRRDSA